MKKVAKYAFLSMFSLATMLSACHYSKHVKKQNQKLEQKVEQYYNYEAYVKKMGQLKVEHPDIVELIPLEPKTWQGRTIYTLKISDKDKIRNEVKDSKDLREPQVLFFGAMHARELISANVTFGIAEYLIENYDRDEKIKRLIDNREVYIIPVLNPDGLDKVMNEIKETGDSRWRKNCRDNNGDGRIDADYYLWNDKTVFDLSEINQEEFEKNPEFKRGGDGVDLNRNFSVGWGEGDASQNSFSPAYAGPFEEKDKKSSKGFTEPEIQAFKNLVDRLDYLVASIDFHSCGKLVLSPPSYKEGRTKDDMLFRKIAEGMQSKQLYDKYTVKHGYKLYLLGGTAEDWLYFKKGVLSYMVEIGSCNGLSCSIIGFFNPSEKDIRKTVDNNVPIAVYLLEIADNPKKVLEE